jgi:hypothetical protein
VEVKLFSTGDFDCSKSGSLRTVFGSFFRFVFGDLDIGAASFAAPSSITQERSYAPASFRGLVLCKAVVGHPRRCYEHGIFETMRSTEPPLDSVRN